MTSGGEFEGVLLVVELVIARQAEVFVRSLEPEEAQRLVKITRATRAASPGRDRAGVGSGRSAAEVAAICAATPQ
ncbi:hypothetical protein OG394_12030 [Kribbella sp. NBC_01245]|uniref:hypothetical protein n=1 Tax=Kribbella sp. NBC_01245 TaxID=2903578 RepID=UPI002E290CCB|nr:hypothetical protein [Kribbella sp. NBC_01245]